MTLPRPASILLPLVLPSALPAQETPVDEGLERPVVQAVRAKGSIQVDGYLNEPGWAEATPE